MHIWGYVHVHVPANVHVHIWGNVHVHVYFYINLGFFAGLSMLFIRSNAISLYAGVKALEVRHIEMY